MVTEENLVFETVQSDPYSTFEYFSALSSFIFYFTVILGSMELYYMGVLA